MTFRAYLSMMSIIMLQAGCAGQPVTYATVYPNVRRAMSSLFPDKHAYDPVVPACTTHVPNDRILGDQIDYACLPSSNELEAGEDIDDPHQKMEHDFVSRVSRSMEDRPHPKNGFLTELSSMCPADRSIDRKLLEKLTEEKNGACYHTVPEQSYTCAAAVDPNIRSCINAVARQAINQCTYLTGRQNQFSASFNFWLLAAQIVFSTAADVVAIRDSSAAAATLAGAFTSVTVANSANIQKTFPPTVGFKIADFESNLKGYLDYSDINEQDMKSITKLRLGLVHARYVAIQNYRHPWASNHGLTPSSAMVPYAYYPDYRRRYRSDLTDTEKALTPEDWQVMNPAGPEMASALKFSLLHDAVLSSCPAINP